MIKTTILAATILFLGTMMVQEVYAPNAGTVDDIKGVAIPDWVKTQFEWYVNEEIDEKTLLTSMNWMFDNNVMHLSEKAALEVQVMRNEINDLKQELEVTIAAIAIPNLLDAKKSANESTSGEIYTDEYGRIKVQFSFDEANKDEVARFTAEIYAEKVDRTLSSNTVWIPMIEDEVLVSFENGDPDRPIITGRVYHSETMPPYKLPDGKMISGVQSNTVPESIHIVVKDPEASTSSAGFPVGSIIIPMDNSKFASEIVDDIMTKGGTASVWEDGLTAFSDMGFKYFPPYSSTSGLEQENRLDGVMIAMAMYTVIEKESQIIDAELKIVEQWLDIIEEKHTTDTAGTSTDYYGRTTTETGTTNYNESDLNFISRILESSDQKIMSLQTGLTVLEQKLQTVGDDAQLANIDLQNSLQKQQQTLQTMSNVSKMLHDTAMSVIQKIG